MQRMLLLDDEPNVLTALKRALRLGFGPELRVEATSDPHIALARLAEVAFDLVVSDYRMPLMDGLTFLKRVRAAHPGVVRVMLSASSEIDTVMNAVNDAEVFRFLAKPWQQEALIAQVREALARAASARGERELADAMRLQTGQASPGEIERRRLEALEPGITHVEWGASGEVLMPTGLPDVTELDGISATEFGRLS